MKTDRLPLERSVFAVYMEFCGGRAIAVSPCAAAAREKAVNCASVAPVSKNVRLSPSAASACMTFSGEAVLPGFEPVRVQNISGR